MHHGGIVPGGCVYALDVLCQNTRFTARLRTERRRLRAPRGLRTPRISIGPAGCRINRSNSVLNYRDYARQGWATKTGHPNWGPRDPG